MSILNSTRWLGALLLVMSASNASAKTQRPVSPETRRKILADLKPAVRDQCATISRLAHDLWLEVEKQSGLSCLSDKRLPGPERLELSRAFVENCQKDLTVMLNREIDQHADQRRYQLPDLDTEQVLGMYARVLYPSYQRFCAEGPSPALAPAGNPEKGEISL